MNRGDRRSSGEGGVWRTRGTVPGTLYLRQPARLVRDDESVADTVSGCTCEPTVQLGGYRGGVPVVELLHDADCARLQRLRGAVMS